MKMFWLVLKIVLLSVISLNSQAADKITPPSPQLPDSYKPYMSELIEAAKKGKGLPFKSMIIDSRTGKVLCRGKNKSRVSPLMHSEIDAINNCVELYGKDMPWQHSALISTAEPCPMCASAALWGHIPLIVYGSSIPDLSAKGWSQINLRAYEIARQSQLGKVQIIGAVMKQETDALFAPRAAPIQSTPVTEAGD